MPNPHNNPPVRAQAPAGSTAGPHVDIIFQGIGRHSAHLGGYIKWAFVGIVGSVLGVLLQKIEFFADYPLGLLGLIGLPGLLFVYLRHRTTKYKLTHRRVEFERGILNRDVDTLELWRVLDVRYHQNIFDRITGNGRITLIGTDKSDPEMLLYGLPNHRALFEKLQDAVQAARQTSRPMELVGQDGNAEEMGGMFGNEQ